MSLTDARRSDVRQPESRSETKLPQRDWILLPVIGLLTIGLLFGSTEWIARRMLTESARGGEFCLVLNDASTGPRGIPNCRLLEKIPEGTLTEYRFNSSGYRDDFEFGPKLPGVYRIVMIGTSDAAGFRVPQKETFGTLLPAKLAQLTGRKIELYNEGLPWRSPEMIAAHFDQVLSTKPDLIFWVLTPLDIGRTAWGVHLVDTTLDARVKVLRDIKAAFAGKTLSASLAELFGHTRTAMLLKDILYASESQYVKSSLIESADKSGYLESEPGAQWEEQLTAFDRSAAKIEGLAREAGVPVVAVLLPDRTQVAMIAMMGERPRGFDPYKLDHDLRSIIVKDGGAYIDILPDFRTVLNPQLGYYPIDGHPNPAGHQVITAFLSRALTDGAVPALQTDNRQASLEEGR